MCCEYVLVVNLTNGTVEILFCLFVCLFICLFVAIKLIDVEVA